MPHPLLLLLVLAGLSAPTVRADAGDIELSVTSEGVVFVSDTVAATHAGNLGFTPSLRAGWSPIDGLTILAGWKSVIGLSQSGHGYELITSGDAIVAGVRYDFGLHPNFDLAVELQLEALHADFELEVAGRPAATSTWGIGAVPKLAAMTRSTLGPFTFDFRVFGGFAARTDLHANDLRLASEAPRRQVAPLDLGRVNLSGFVFGADFAVIF